VKLISRFLSFLLIAVPGLSKAQIPPLTLYPTAGNLILATPCGSAGTPLWRAVCPSDMTSVFSAANTWTALQAFPGGISAGPTAAGIGLNFTGYTFSAQTLLFGNTNQASWQNATGSFTASTVGSQLYKGSDNNQYYDNYDSGKSHIFRGNGAAQQATIGSSGIASKIHIGGSGSAPAISSCGTGPSLSGGANGIHGTVPIGTSGTGCTITFAAAYTNAPDCTVSSPGAGAIGGYSTITTALTLTGLTASKAYTYACLGR
jgi:hypothetical protein